MLAQKNAQDGKCTIITIDVPDYKDTEPSKGDFYMYIQKSSDCDFVEIDWGDGSDLELIFDDSAEVELKHHYSPGIYNIRIDDSIAKIGFIKYVKNEKGKDVILSYLTTSKDLIIGFDSYALKLTEVFDRCF